MKNQMSYSSFWLDKSIWDDDQEVTKVEKKSSDLMKLVSYKKSISNFVTIVTGQPIPVTFNVRGEDSYTDGKEVVISAKLDDKEFDPIVGLALHEGSHIKLTDFETLKDLSYGKLPDNIPFSTYMDLSSKHGYDSSPEGIGSWSRDYAAPKIKNLLNYVEDRRIDNYIYQSAPGYRGYYEAMYNKYFHSKVVDKGLQSSEYRTEDWDSYMFRLINLTNKNRDLTALKGLKDIWNLLDLGNVSRLKSSDDSLKLAAQIFVEIEKHIDVVSSSEDQQSNGSGEGDNQNDETNGNSPMTGDTENNPTTEGGMNANGQGETSPSDSNDGTPSGSSDDESGTGYSSNPTGAGGDPLNDRQKKMLDNAIKKQKDFMDGEVNKKSVTKSDKNKIDTLDKADIETTVTGKGMQQGYWRNVSQGVQTYIIKNFTKSLVSTGMIDMCTEYDWKCDKNQENIQKGIQLGTILGKKLKTRNEERVLTTPRMTTGKLNGRMLHEIGFGNFKIFDQVNIDTSTPSLLHISVDASSSMNGSKWDNTQVAVVAIAKAASMTQNMDVVISYRGIYHQFGTRHIQPLMLIAYDSRKDKFSKVQQLFKHLQSSGTTPEGLCFEAVLKEIVKTKNGTDS